MCSLVTVSVKSSFCFSKCFCLEFSGLATSTQLPPAQQSPKKPGFLLVQHTAKHRVSSTVTAEDMKNIRFVFLGCFEFFLVDWTSRNCCLKDSKLNFDISVGSR